MTTNKYWVIGRGAECDLVVNHPSVSTRHCRLIQTTKGLFLEDLQSTNGTFVNGVQVVSKVQISPRDRITLGLDAPLPWPPEIVLSVPRSPLLDRASDKSLLPEFLSVPAEGQSIVFGRDANCDQVLDYPKI